MSEESDSITEEERSLFRPFTRESLTAIEARIAEEHAKQKELEKKRAEGEVRYDDEDEDEGPQPDPALEQGAPIPVRLHNVFPPELASTPLEDIDTFYQNQRLSGVFVVFRVIFTGIYTFESAVKVMARGFILQPFTYLRDAWNWLDFVVIALA
ncbi:hypothetical protein M0802_001199 [Mischocyttarus mexicanus]|nr:hypothetical protein M0802_001199 [Mischocyttarus mexicanus]